MLNEMSGEEPQQNEASRRVFGEWAPSPELSDARFLRRVQQLLDATTDAIVFLDRGYNLTFLNRRAKELLAPRGDVLGKNLFESFPGIVYENSPYVETHRKSMEEGVAGEFEAYYPAPLHLWLRVQSYPADDGIIVFLRDVTEERRAGQELREKREEAERQRMEIETVYRTAPDRARALRHRGFSLSPAERPAGRILRDTSGGDCRPHVDGDGADRGAAGVV